MIPIELYLIDRPNIFNYKCIIAHSKRKRRHLLFCNSKILNGFIVFEGLDGAGTSTQLKLLEKKLKLHEISARTTYEPTNGAIGKLIRNILSGKEPMEKSSLARLFSADRNEHLYGRNGIQELCESGELVICDRYLFSSLAYQGADIGMEKVYTLNAGFPLPEILFFFDVDPRSGEKRYRKRKRLEIYENRNSQEKVRTHYYKLLKELETSNVQLHIINSEKNIEEISRELWSILSAHPIVKM